MTLILILLGVFLLLVVVTVIVYEHFFDDRKYFEGTAKPHPHEIHRLADDGCPHADPSLHCDLSTSVSGDVKNVKWVDSHNIPYAMGDGSFGIVPIDGHVELEIGFSDTLNHRYTVGEDAKISHNGTDLNLRQFYDDFSVAVSNGKKLWADLELKEDRVACVTISEKP